MARIALARVRGASSRQLRCREQRSMARGQVQSRHDACSQYGPKKKDCALDRQARRASSCPLATRVRRSHYVEVPRDMLLGCADVIRETSGVAL